MQRDDIENIFKIFHELNPKPKTELEYKNDFTLLVAVVLSAQSTDLAVNKATKDLFNLYDTPEQIFLLGEDALKQYIKTIGLYNSKAANIIKLSEILMKKYESKVPDNIEDLIKLPGVGRKTANVVLNALFGKATMPVDTHVARVSQRLELSNEKTPDKIEAELMSVIPDKWLTDAHHWLVLHGRYICKARKPLCLICPITSYCPYIAKSL